MLNKKVVIGLVSGFLLSSVNLQAAEKQEVKCHVSLLGGNQTIYLGLLPKKAMKTVAAELKGKMIMTTISAQKQKVYEVFECVLQHQQFSSASARFIESQIEL